MNRRSFFGGMLACVGLGAAKPSKPRVEDAATDAAVQHIKQYVPEPWWELWHPSINGEVISGRWILKCKWEERYEVLFNFTKGFKHINYRRVEINRDKEGFAMIKCFRGNDLDVVTYYAGPCNCLGGGPCTKGRTHGYNIRRVVTISWEERMAQILDILNHEIYDGVHVERSGNNAIIKVF